VTALCHCQHYGYYLLSPVLQHIGSMGNDLGGGAIALILYFWKAPFAASLMRNATAYRCRNKCS